MSHRDSRSTDRRISECPHTKYILREHLTKMKKINLQRYFSWFSNHRFLCCPNLFEPTVLDLKFWLYIALWLMNIPPRISVGIFFYGAFPQQTCGGIPRKCWSTNHSVPYRRVKGLHRLTIIRIGLTEMQWLISSQVAEIMVIVNPILLKNYWLVTPNQQHCL